MGLVTGVHHLAISTADIKGQVEFFTDVLGCELKAFYWMHGTDGTMHAFVRLNDSQAIAFVYNETHSARIEPLPGVSHPRGMVTVAAPGTLHHIALRADSTEELLALRDRIRSKGRNVFGPVDHGFCRSIYFAGPERLILEISTSDEPIDERRWIDPEVVARVGITPEDVERYRHPEPHRNSTGSPLPNPPIDPAHPVLPMPAELYEKLMTISDAEVGRMLDETEPPVPLVEA